MRSAQEWLAIGESTPAQDDDKWRLAALDLIRSIQRDAVDSCIARIRKFWHRKIDGHAGQPYMRQDPHWAEACCRAALGEVSK